MTSDIPRIATFLIGDIVKKIDKFVGDQSAQLIAVIGPAASACMTVYVVLWGAAVAGGRASEPFGDGVGRILKMCAIVILALSAGNYHSVVAKFFLDAPVAIAFEMSGKDDSSSEVSCGSVEAAGPSNLADPIDKALCLGIEIGNRAWDESERASGIAAEIGLTILAFIVYISVGLVSAVALSIVFMSYVCLAILLGVGPLFIFGMLFEKTSRFFELWLAQVMNFAILFVLVASVMSLSLSIFNAYISDMRTSNWSESIVNTVKIVVASLTIGGVLLQTRIVASAIAGGVALSGQNVAGRLLGGASKAYGAAKSATGAVKAGGEAMRSGAQHAKSAVGSAVGLARRKFGS